MASTSGRSLSKETVDICLALLARVQGQDSHTPKERAAVTQLIEWLADFDVSESSDTDDALDESSRALLASFTGRHRKRLAAGLGELVGSNSSPGLRASIAKQPRTAGQEQLAAELDKIDDWAAFDVFKVAELSHGRALELVTLALVDRFELVEKLRLDKASLQSFLQDIEHSYDDVNPYHNSTHAADVTQSLGCILVHEEFSAQLSDMELFCMIIAAAVHDVGHPGVSNEFLVNSGAEAAVEYNDTSVNENMHAATAFRILLRPGNNFLAAAGESHYHFFRRTVISIVLSTDMAQHTELVGDFTAAVNILGKDISSWRPDQRLRLQQMCVHCSDIANPAKPLRFSKEWSERVLTEFFAQGDLERSRGMAISPQCDREKVEIAKSQLVFLERVVRPCYSVFAQVAPKTAALALRYVDEASAHWERLQATPNPAAAEKALPCSTQAAGDGATSHSCVFPLEDV